MPSTQPAKAVIYVDGQSETSGVRFQFNPESIQVSHGANARELGVEKADTDDANGKAKDGNNLTPQQLLEKAGKTSLKLSKLTFDGLHVPADCGKLLTWSYAYEDPETKEVLLTPLVFAWGEFVLGANAKSAIKVQITKADVTYTRFTPAGRPIRASVSLDLQPQASNPFEQNPTSAGLPNRQMHVVVAGESLASIARSRYGRPGHWRRLAEANGIDDPLRTRPGQTLYLPDRSEFLGLGAQ